MTLSVPLHMFWILYFDGSSKNATVRRFITIEKVNWEADTIWTVECQLKEFQGKHTEQINGIETRHIQNPNLGYRDICDITLVTVRTVPVKDKVCDKSGYKGNFQSQCRTRKHKCINLVDTEPFPKFKDIIAIDPYVNPIYQPYQRCIWLGHNNRNTYSITISSFDFP